MKTWKWSTGEPYYKSARPEKTGEESKTNTNTNLDPNYEYDSQKNAINQSLADDSFFNQDSDLLNITNTMFSRNQTANETRAQRGVNPFLQTSYVNDIVTRDMYLKPVNTTHGREKETVKEE